MRALSTRLTAIFTTRPSLPVTDPPPGTTEVMASSVHVLRRPFGY